ncbi:hypothetical protein GCM10010913_16100 [Paenibacillus aceti]|uniref:Uncharacterized protein n=1 Tax=Paenibacillus aceti TaxID=1820010 RepID=A0ABQ1VSK0_9BACL|nr:hypothetical protein GCM10010913_16100 [Paenibacillus aceti]
MVQYRDFCVKYTDEFQTGYLLFKVILGSFAAFVLPVGVFLLSRDPGGRCLRLCPAVLPDHGAGHFCSYVQDYVLVLDTQGYS